MSQPTTLPNWATDVNYPAGSDPWSGQPTKVEPLSGEKAVGNVPATEPAAEWLNWWMNLVYLWIAFLGNFTKWLGPGSPMTTAGWTRTISGFFSDTSGGGTGIMGLAGPDIEFHLDLPAGTRITAITVYGRAGNSGSEILASCLRKITTGGVASAVSTNKTSSTTNGNTSIGWTTSDTDFTPNGYVMTGDRHSVIVELPNTSVAGEVAVYGVQVTVA